MTRSIRFLCIAALTVIGLVGSTLPVRADDRDHERHEQCERRIHRAEQNLQDAINRHGEGSRQAHKRHEQLEEVRRECDRDRDHHEMEHHDDDRPHQ